MRDSLVRGGGGGGTSDSDGTDQNGDDSEENGDSSSGSIADRVRDAASSATDTASDAVDDASDAVSGARDTASDAADSVRDRTDSSSDSDSTTDDEDDSSAAEDDSSAAEDAVDRIRDTASEAVDRATDTADEIDAGRVDAGRVGGADQITRFESDQIESDLRSNVAEEFDDVGEDDVQIQQQNGSFEAQVGDQTVAEIGQDEFAETAATGIDQVGRDDLRAEFGDGGVDIVADDDVQRQLMREAVAADDSRLEQDDVELSRDGDEFEVQLRGDSARRVEEGVSGSDLRSTAAGVGGFVGSQFESAVDSSDAIAQGLSFNIETVQQASVDPAADALGMDETDSRPERARSQREQSTRDQLRQDVAQDSEFDEDEIAIGFDVGSGEFTASPTDDAIEQRVRQDVAEDEPNVDPEDVIVDRDGDDVDISFDREAGVSGVVDIARGDQTTRDFLRAEDDRWVDISQELGEGIGDLGGGGRGRELTGTAVGTGGEWVSPAGTALFIDEFDQEIDDRAIPFDPTGATALLTVGEDEAETARDVTTDAAEFTREEPAEAAAMGVGITAATLAPAFAPRAVRDARSAADSAEIRRFIDDEQAMVRLDQRQRTSTDSQGQQRTIERDSPEADPSDPTVSERVDQITERWGGEGTMTRPDRGLDEEIVVEPQQRGPQQRSAEDQLPPREEFPSDAAYQRELEAVRERMRSQEADAQAATQEATADSTVPGEGGQTRAIGELDVRQQQEVTADSTVPGDGGRTIAVEEFDLRRQQQQEVAADSTVPQEGRTLAIEDMATRFDQRQTAAASVAVPGMQLTDTLGTDAQLDVLQVQDQQADIDADLDADLDAAFDADSMFGTLTTAQLDTAFDSTQAQTQAQTQTQAQSQQAQTRQPSPRRGRTRFEFPELEDGAEIDGGFDFAFGDDTFETGIADADDFFGDENGRLF